MKIERTTKSVIENRLLVALEEDSTKVAILLSQQDLQDMVGALTDCTVWEERDVYLYEKPETITEEDAHIKIPAANARYEIKRAWRDRCQELLTGYRQLMAAAFPPK